MPNASTGTIMPEPPNCRYSIQNPFREYSNCRQLTGANPAPYTIPPIKEALLTTQFYQSHQPNQTTALVLGASIAGLWTARVLADHFDQVLVLDRDVLPQGS